MNGQMKGWNFLPKKQTQTFSADGSTSTIDTLKAEKTRLEKRLADIPGLISRLDNSISLVQQDITWLNGISKHKAKQWEKDNGKSREQAIYDGKNVIVSYQADQNSLRNELARIPQQIKDVDTQISTIINGEGTGLSKGLSKDTARQLGQLELTKEQNQITVQKQIDQANLQTAQIQTQTAQQQATQKTAMSPQLKWGIIIGTAVLIAIISYVIYRHKQAKLAALGMPQPLKL